MKPTYHITFALLLSAALTGCQTQSQQTSSQQPPQPSSPSSSSPSAPSIPSTPSTPSTPSLPSPSSPSSSQSQSSDSSSSQQDSSQKETAEDSYGKRSGSEDRQSEDIPDPSSEPRGESAEIAVMEEILEVLDRIEEQLEQTAQNEDLTPEQAQTIEQYEQVLEDLEVQVGELEPETLDALLEVLKDLEQTIASANEEAEQQGDHSIPVSVTVTQVAILQDLIEILGIPGGLPGIGLPSIPVGLPSGGDQTLADLDATLEASIGVFDGMILSERVSAQGKPGEFGDESDVYTGGGEDLFEEGSLGEGEGAGNQQTAQAPEIPTGEQPTSSQQQSQSASGAGGGAQQKAAKVPDDIPDGRDDDIVARQIREAAMKAEDPELREKLWEEYRKYKKGK